MNPVLLFAGIMGATFILEDPTTLAVGAMVAQEEISFLFGVMALGLGIFFGDLGLYGIGYLCKKKIFSGSKKSFTPSLWQISLARFLPGARTITFMASGHNEIPLGKFLLVIFPSAIVWTLLLLLFTDQVFNLTHALPLWMNWVIGIVLFLILTKIRTLFKLLGMGLLIFSVCLHHSLLLKHRGRKILSHSLSRYCRLALKILNVDVQSRLTPEEVSGKLVVSHHMSYLDVICLASLYPGIYVTSVEIRETPILGFICDVCGCLFTERRRQKSGRQTMEQELQDMQAVLSDGIAVTLFPEGTSTNGFEVLSFKTAFFEAALKAQATVKPVLLRYTEIDGEAFSQKNHDIVCWYGKMSFFPHFLRLCDAKLIVVKVDSLADIDSRAFSDRKVLTAESFRVMDEARRRAL